MKRNPFKFAALNSFKILCTISVILLTCAIISAQTVATKKLGRVNLFAGVWETVSNQGNKYRITLQQDGKRVTGTYQPHNGTIDGEIDGAVLRFKWTQGD